MNVAEELADLFLDVNQQHRDITEPMAREYWQGKKDGLRTALALLDKENAAHWEGYQKSSHNQRLTKLQILTEMVNDAVYYIGEVLWSQRGGNIHPMSFLNMEQWFDRYQREAKGEMSLLLMILVTLYEQITEIVGCGGNIEDSRCV